MNSRVEAPDQVVIVLDADSDGARAPVALQDVGGRPFLDYLLENCARHGFRDVLLLAHRAADRFANYAAARTPPFAFSLEVVATPDADGAGAALRQAADRLADRFLLLTGARFFDINWLDAMLATASDPVPLVVAAMRRGAPPAEAARGVYLVDRRVLPHLHENGSFESSLPSLGRFVAYREYDGFFVDLRTPQGLSCAQAELPKRRTRPAVFFDRDGTLNADTGYVYRAEDLVFLPGAIDAVKRVNDLNRYAFLVTNQSGVARGYYTEADVQAFHALMQRRLRAAGAHLDDIRYCPTHPEATIPAYAGDSDWRKPGPGMLLDLLRTWPIVREASLVIGDQPRDMEAAQRAGLSGVHYKGGNLARLLDTHIMP